MTCKTCEGTGGVGWYENHSPYGSGQDWSMYMTDLCPDCADKGLCPKCDIKMTFNEEKFCYFCSNCGYDESEGVK